MEEAKEQSEKKKYSEPRSDVDTAVEWEGGIIDIYEESEEDQDEEAVDDDFDILQNTAAGAGFQGMKLYNA